MAMANLERYPVKIIESGHVSPPPNSVPATSMPLSFLDIPWMFNVFTRVVSFYEIPVSNSDFTTTILPALRNSLSIALGKFYPLAAKIVVPPFPGKPQIVYTDDGDSVPFTVAESTEDFREIISNDPQDVKLLHPLVPELSPPTMSEEGICTISPLLAIQVTVFPNSGICIGAQYNHVISDGRSFQHFMKSWASIYRTGDLQSSLIPSLNRDIIEDPNDLQSTLSLLKSWWDYASPRGLSRGSRPTNADQRATFTLSKTTINRLKSWISNQSTILDLDPMSISSFAAACAFTWVCVVKSTNKGGLDPLVSPEQDEASKKPQLCHFVYVADCRNRLETPLPETYFGNCLMSRIVAMEKNALLGRDGTVLAARAIARNVEELGNGCVQIRGGERRVSEVSSIARKFGSPPLSVAGSPHLNVYDTDFGWGRPKKIAVVHIDGSLAISLAENRDEKGGMEVGVALSKDSMDAFTALFNQLESLII